MLGLHVARSTVRLLGLTEFPGVFLIGLLLLILAATISYYFFEKRFLACANSRGATAPKRTVTRPSSPCAGWTASFARLAGPANTAIRRHAVSSSLRPAACRPRPKPGPSFTTRTPLTKWFLAIHLMTGAKNVIAALKLARQLGVNSRAVTEPNRR